MRCAALISAVSLTITSQLLPLQRHQPWSFSVEALLPGRQPLISPLVQQLFQKKVQCGQVSVSFKTLDDASKNGLVYASSLSKKTSLEALSSSSLRQTEAFDNANSNDKKKRLVRAPVSPQRNGQPNPSLSIFDKATNNIDFFRNKSQGQQQQRGGQLYYANGSATLPSVAYFGRREAKIQNKSKNNGGQEDESKLKRFWRRIKDGGNGGKDNEKKKQRRSGGQKGGPDDEEEGNFFSKVFGARKGSKEEKKANDEKKGGREKKKKGLVSRGEEMISNFKDSASSSDRDNRVDKLEEDFWTRLTKGSPIDSSIANLSPQDQQVLQELKQNIEAKKKRIAEASQEGQLAQREADMERSEQRKKASEKRALIWSEERKRREKELVRLERQRNVLRASLSSKAAAQKDAAAIKGKKEEASPSPAPRSRKKNNLSSMWDAVRQVGVGANNNRTKGEEWIVVCPKTRVAPGVTLPVEVGGIDLLIVASKDAKNLYCVANSCPHLGTPLETGVVEQRVVAPSEAEQVSWQQQPQQQCEDCIVCPMHNTAFALDSGEVRGEWCPYPPVIGAVMGTVKPKSNLPTFAVRTKGKNIEVRINSALASDDDEEGKGRRKKRRK